MSHTVFTQACSLAVPVETNTPMGGDTGHGGETVVLFSDLGGTDMSGDVNDRGTIEAMGGEIKLLFRGDHEAVILADALSWAGKELRRQIYENADEQPRRGRSR